MPPFHDGFYIHSAPRQVSRKGYLLARQVPETLSTRVKNPLKGRRRKLAYEANVLCKHCDGQQLAWFLEHHNEAARKP